jgi:hypothetical protein
MKLSTSDQVMEKNEIANAKSIKINKYRKKEKTIIR